MPDGPHRREPLATQTLVREKAWGATNRASGPAPRTGGGRFTHDEIWRTGQGRLRSPVGALLALGEVRLLDRNPVVAQRFAEANATSLTPSCSTPSSLLTRGRGVRRGSRRSP
jgi:hypothetical protein